MNKWMNKWMRVEGWGKSRTPLQALMWLAPLVIIWPSFMGIAFWGSIFAVIARIIWKIGWEK